MIRSIRNTISHVILQCSNIYQLPVETKMRMINYKLVLLFAVCYYRIKLESRVKNKKKRRKKTEKKFDKYEHRVRT